MIWKYIVIKMVVKQKLKMKKVIKINQQNFLFDFFIYYYFIILVNTIEMVIKSRLRIKKQDKNKSI